MNARPANAPTTRDTRVKKENVWRIILRSAWARDPIDMKLADMTTHFLRTSPLPQCWPCRSYGTDRCSVVEFCDATMISTSTRASPSFPSSKPKRAAVACGGCIVSHPRLRDMLGSAWSRQGSFDRETHSARFRPRLK